MKLLGAFMLVGLFGGGCGSDANPTALRVYCGALCNAAHVCGSSLAQDACTTQCVSDSPDMLNISREGAGLLGQCMQRLSCQTLFDVESFSDTFASCWKQAAQRIRPRPRVRAFCERFSHALFECGQWLAVDDCAHAYSLREDSFTQSLGHCMKKTSCDELTACVAEQLE